MKGTDLKTRPSIPGSTAVQQTVPVDKAGNGSVTAQNVALREPDSTRTPLGEQANIGATSRQVHGQLQVRSGRSGRAHQGTRSKKLKEERLDDLGRLERVSFGPLAERLRGVLATVQASIGDIAGRDPKDVHAAIDSAFEPSRASFSTAIQQAIRGPRSSLTKSGIDAMRASGADTLMMHVLIEGKLTMPMVHAEMQRLTQGLRDGRLSVADIKKGLVTADGLLQRFRLAGVEVQHEYKGNGPRDLLLSFASSLHR